jgi:CRISPR type I-E-associated protein CasB/Cse2
MIDPPAPASQLISALERRSARGLGADAADLALLRRALPLIPDHPDPRALALVAGYCGATRPAQDAGLLTASLWATHHRGTQPRPATRSLGRALRVAPAGAGERAWLRLCAASDTALPRAMAEAVAVLTAHGIATDWHRLHRDLRSWYQGSREAVLRRWCTGLFGPAHDGTREVSP